MKKILIRFWDCGFHGWRWHIEDPTLGYVTAASTFDGALRAWSKERDKRGLSTR